MCVCVFVCLCVYVSMYVCNNVCNQTTYSKRQKGAKILTKAKVYTNRTLIVHIFETSHLLGFPVRSLQIIPELLPGNFISRNCSQISLVSRISRVEMWDHTLSQHILQSPLNYRKDPRIILDICWILQG